MLKCKVEIVGVVYHLVGEQSIDHVAEVFEVFLLLGCPVDFIHFVEGQNVAQSGEASLFLHLLYVLLNNNEVVDVVGLEAYIASTRLVLLLDQKFPESVGLVWLTLAHNLLLLNNLHVAKVTDRILNHVRLHNPVELSLGAVEYVALLDHGKGQLKKHEEGELHSCICPDERH